VNNTDESLDFHLDDTSINGVMFPGFSYETVAAGKKANETLEWDLDDLAEAGIEAVTEAEFSLEIETEDGEEVFWRLLHHLSLWRG